MTADVEAERWVPMSLRRADGERGLLRALLMEAVRCALGEAGGRQAKRAQLAAEARRWITRANVGEPFAFENVCAWLGLPAHRLRRFVLEWVELLRPSAPVVARQGSSGSGRIGMRASGSFGQRAGSLGTSPSAST